MALATHFSCLLLNTLRFLVAKEPSSSDSCFAQNLCWPVHSAAVKTVVTAWISLKSSLKQLLGTCITRRGALKRAKVFSFGCPQDGWIWLHCWNYGGFTADGIFSALSLGLEEKSFSAFYSEARLQTGGTSVNWRERAGCWTCHFSKSHFQPITVLSATGATPAWISTAQL